MTDPAVLFQRKADVPVLRRLAMVNDYPFTGREIARLEGLNPTTARRSLEALTKIGLVHCQYHRHAYLYSLNREHFLWPPTERLIAGGVAGPAKRKRSKTMLVEHILRDYRDGDEHGWDTEFAYLISQHHLRIHALLLAVRASGMQNPILLGSDGRVWDGHHRLLVARILGLKRVPVTFSDGD